MPDPIDPVTEGTAEKSKCLHCKKSVVTSVECLKCGGNFHPACMVQANEAKNRQCRHMDGKALTKEVESQSKIIQKLITRINMLEDVLAKKSENLESASENFDKLPEKVEVLENEIRQLKTNHTNDAAENGATLDCNIRSFLSSELKDQSEAISNKLDGVVEAIICTNKELVAFLTENPRLINNSHQPINRKEKDIREVSARNGAACQDPDLEILGNYSSRTSKPGVAIKGTSNTATDIAAATERRWIYVGNLASGCTADKVKNHLANKSISVLSCEKLGEHDDYAASFKLSVQPELESAIMNSDIWPTDVVVKPFVFRNAARRFSRGRPQNFQDFRRRNFHRENHRGQWKPGASSM